MAESTERRRAPRGTHEEAVVIKVISSDDSNITPGRTFFAKTADISMQGLRLRMNHEAAIGSVLELWVVSHLHQGTLVLNGTVRWSRPIKQDSYSQQIGLELSNEHAEDFAKWQQIVAALMPHTSRPAAP
jgi:hypothetical protein